MSSRADGFQSLLALLLSDPALIVKLHADPETFAAAHGVDRSLVDQLRELDPERLRISATLISARNRWQVQRSLPASVDLMHRLSREHKAVQEAMERVRPERARDAAEFAECLTKLADALPATWPALVLRELIRFELMWRDLRERVPGPAAPVSGSFPVVKPRVTMAAFELPVADVCRRILTGRSHADVATRRTWYVLAMDDGACTRISVVPEVLYDVLRLCDGTRTTCEIANCLSLPPVDVERLVRVARVKAFLAET
jgi:hypothetical protein